MRSFRLASSLAIVALLGVTPGLAQKLGVQKIQYYFPLNAAQGIPAATTIIVRPGDLLNSSTVTPSVFTIIGTKSGRHTVTVTISDDRKTIIARPTTAFASGERVTVTLSRGIKTLTGATIDGMSFSFVVAVTGKHGTVSYGPLRPEHQVSARSTRSRWMAGSDSLPMDFPAIQVMSESQPAPGDIFIAAFDGSQYPSQIQPYLMVLGDSARVNFWRRGGTRLWDLSLQPNGMLTYFADETKRWYAMDSNYNVIDSFQCGNGYTTDMHDLVIMPNGHAFVIGMDTLHNYNLSEAIMGGDSNASIVGCVVQELDREKNVIFNWRSFDEGNYDPLDATHENLMELLVDAVHANALQIDVDGNILLSARNMDEITKISVDSGEIIWRLGGKHSNFTFLNDSIGFSHQHGLKLLDNGHILLFDNGNFHEPSFSRGCEYELDTVAMTAKLVWQFDHGKSIQSFSMGSVQRLANGNTLIGWGFSNAPVASEVRPDGTIAFEFSMDDPFVTYRVYKFPWKDTKPLAVSSELPPATISLSAPYPNPLRTESAVQFSLSEQELVTIELIDALGRPVRTLSQAEFPEGTHTVPLELQGIAQGSYRLLLKAGLLTASREIVIIR